MVDYTTKKKKADERLIKTEFVRWPGRRSGNEGVNGRVL